MRERERKGKGLRLRQKEAHQKVLKKERWITANNTMLGVRQGRKYHEPVKDGHIKTALLSAG